MSLVSRIQELIASDDDDQSERLASEYTEATKEAKEAIDNAFICLCGWSLATIIADELDAADDGMEEACAEVIRATEEYVRAGGK